jgi:hypothetical protein
MGEGVAVGSSIPMRTYHHASLLITISECAGPLEGALNTGHTPLTGEAARTLAAGASILAAAAACARRPHMRVPYLQWLHLLRVMYAGITSFALRGNSRGSARSEGAPRDSHCWVPTTITAHRPVLAAARLIAGPWRPSQQAKWS